MGDGNYVENSLPARVERSWLYRELVLQEAKWIQIWCYPLGGSVLFYDFFLVPHLWHMEVPSLRVELELQLRPTPQPQQCQIRVTSASYVAACGNAGSLTHWARPGTKPKSSWILALLSHSGNSFFVFFLLCPRHVSNLCHSSDNTRALNCCVTRELWLWGSRCNRTPQRKGWAMTTNGTLGLRREAGLAQQLWASLLCWSPTHVYDLPRKRYIPREEGIRRQDFVRRLDRTRRRGRDSWLLRRCHTNHVRRGAWTRLGWWEWGEMRTDLDKNILWGSTLFIVCPQWFHWQAGTIIHYKSWFIQL